jgi:50S ribosomal subunit-associated GTPase HflX
MENITNDRTISHPFDDNLKLSYLVDENKEMQIISLPYNFVDDFTNSNDFKKINKKILINVFDVSSNSDDIENQIKNFKKILPKFGNINKIIVANKTDIADNKKLNKLKIRFKNLHKTSSVTRNGLKELKSHILSK